MFLIQQQSWEKTHRLMMAQTVLPETKELFRYIAQEQKSLFVWFNERSKVRSPANGAVMNFVLLAIAVEKAFGTDIPIVTNEMVIETIREYGSNAEAAREQWTKHYETVQPHLVPFFDSVLFPRMAKRFPMTPAHRIGALEDAFLMLRPFEK